MGSETSEPPAPAQNTASASQVPTTEPKTKKSTPKNKRKADGEDESVKKGTPSTEPAPKKPRTKKTAPKVKKEPQPDPDSTQDAPATPNLTAAKARKNPTQKARTKKSSSQKLSAKPNEEMPFLRASKQDQPPPPTPLTIPVANKIAQIEAFLKTFRHSLLDRDDPATTPHLVSVPESSLLSAVMRMETHYQLPPPTTTTTDEPLAAVESAIVSRFKRPIGSNKDIDWVTVDLSQRTELEEAIRAKIGNAAAAVAAGRRGLFAAVNLLEMELEMFARDHLRREGLPLPAGCEGEEERDEGWDPVAFARRFGEVWDSVGGEKRMGEGNRDGGLNGDGGAGEPVNGKGQDEVGRMGVCPVPLAAI